MFRPLCDTIMAQVYIRAHVCRHNSLWSQDIATAKMVELMR